MLPDIARFGSSPTGLLSIYIYVAMSFAICSLSGCKMWLWNIQTFFSGIVLHWTGGFRGQPIQWCHSDLCQTYSWCRDNQLLLEHELSGKSCHSCVTERLVRRTNVLVNDGKWDCLYTNVLKSMRSFALDQGLANLFCGLGPDKPQTNLLQAGQVYFACGSTRARFKVKTEKLMLARLMELTAGFGLQVGIFQPLDQTDDMMTWLQLNW